MAQPWTIRQDPKSSEDRDHRGQAACTTDPSPVVALTATGLEVQVCDPL
jgi:hypothetical protein